MMDLCLLPPPTVVESAIPLSQPDEAIRPSSLRVLDNRFFGTATPRLKSIATSTLERSTIKALTIKEPSEFIYDYFGGTSLPTLAHTCSYTEVTSGVGYELGFGLANYLAPTAHADFAILALWTTEIADFVHKEVLPRAQQIIDPANLAFAPAINPETSARFTMIMKALPSNLQHPHVSSSEDGEIGLSWFDGPNRFEAMIEDESVAWVSKIDNTYQGGEVTDLVDSSQLNPLFEALTKFYGFRRSLSL